MSGTGRAEPAGDDHDIFGPLERSGAARGVLLVAGAVIVGALLLPSASRPPLRASAVAARSGATVPPTTLPSGGAPSTTSPPAVPASSVKVLVANGTNRNGAAGAVTSLLASKGFATLSPVDALTTVPSTQVYAIGGDTAAAIEVASALGLGASAVQPASTPVPVSSSAGATVVVVVGPDLASRS
jgi:hypothetical protein